MKKTTTPQKKEHCVNYAIAHPERSLSALAKEFDVGYSTLVKWVKQARDKGLAGAERQLSEEQLEIQRLRKENARLREVNEIIKKAHVYFVNNPSR